MKNTKIILSVLLALVMVFGVVSLVACNPNKGGNKPIELVLWTPSGAQEFYKEWANNWANGYVDAKGVEHEGFKDAEGHTYKVSLGVFEEDGVKDILINSPTDGADVFLFVDDHMADMIDNNLLALVGDTTREGTVAYDVAHRNSESSVEAASYNGELRAYPMQADNTYFLFYNSTILSDEDVLTWDGIFDRLAEVNQGKTGNDRVTVQLDYGVSWYQAAWFFTYGGKADASNFGDPDVAYKALQAAYEFSSQPDFKSQSASLALPEGLIDGSIAAGIAGTWICVDELKNLIDDGTIKLTILPKIRLSTDPKEDENSYVQMKAFLGCKLIGVNAQGPYVTASHYLANFLTSEEVQIAKALALGAGPSNKVAASLPEVLALPTVQVVAQQALYSVPQAMFPAAGFTAVSAPINAVDGSTPTTSSAYFGADGKCIAEKVDPMLTAMMNTIFPKA